MEKSKANFLFNFFFFFPLSYAFRGGPEPEVWNHYYRNSHTKLVKFGVVKLGMGVQSQRFNASQNQTFGVWHTLTFIKVKAERFTLQLNYNFHNSTIVWMYPAAFPHERLFIPVAFHHIFGNGTTSSRLVLIISSLQKYSRATQASLPAAPA